MKYLENGQEVDVVGRLENGKFVVSELIETEGQYGCVNGQLLIVDSVLDNPPHAIVDKAILEKQNQINDLNLQLGKLKINIRMLENEKQARLTNLDNGVINIQQLKAAKRLHCFLEYEIMPIEITMNTFKLIFCYTLHKTNIEIHRPSRGDDPYYFLGRVDNKYGFMIDKTDEEINEVTKKRLNSMVINDYKLITVNDELLNPVQLQSKNKLLLEKANKEKQDKQSELNKKRQELEKLQKELEIL
jgi:vacuolar-type H+-ATPase subunit I/STV1